MFCVIFVLCYLNLGIHLIILLFSAFSPIFDRERGKRREGFTIICIRFFVINFGDLGICVRVARNTLAKESRGVQLQIPISIILLSSASRADVELKIRLSIKVSKIRRDKDKAPSLQIPTRAFKTILPSRSDHTLEGGERDSCILVLQHARLLKQRQG